jgi:membrane-associated phospholipid phosphatase
LVSYKNNNILKYNNLKHTHKLKSVVLTLKKMCIIVLASSALTTKLFGQNLQLSSKREVTLGSSMILLSGASLYLSQHYNTPSNTWQIKGIDQWNKPFLNKRNATISDITFISTLAASTLSGLALPKQQQLAYGVVMAQNVWLTANVVQISKVLVGRNRPYLKGTGLIEEEHSDNYYSFFSGHSALCATMATTALLATYKNYNGSALSWGKATALSGVALALSTGILRITAGKHYPSDVLTGLIVGTSIALINTMLHETK